MAKLRRLGDLERAVMDHPWDTDVPQTVREVRDARAFRYYPTHGRDELLARLTVDALDQLAEVESHRHGLRDQSYSDQHPGFDSTVPQRLSCGCSESPKAFDGEGILCSAS